MIIVAIATWLLFLGATQLHAQGQFYEGKTIRIVVGLPAGDAYDRSLRRMAAAHMDKYIPGYPAFIVQNMPGASSMITANHVYAIGKPDGLTLVRFYPRSISTNCWDARKYSLMAEIHMAGKLREIEQFALHAVGYSLQKYPPGYKKL